MKANILKSLTTCCLVAAFAASLGAHPGDILQTYTNPNGAPGHKFGSDVATYGGSIIASAPEENGGRVYIINPATGDLAPLPMPGGVTFARFGSKLVSKGSRLYVTDTGAVVEGRSGIGAVFIYDSINDSNPLIITDPHGSTSSEFAADIDATVLGNFVVGAPNSPKEAYAYTPNTTTPSLILSYPFISHEVGTVVRVSETGRVALSADAGLFTGVVHLYTLADGSYYDTVSRGVYSWTNNDIMFDGDTLYTMIKPFWGNEPTSIFQIDPTTGDLQHQYDSTSETRTLNTPFHIMPNMIVVGASSLADDLDLIHFFDKNLNPIAQGVMAEVARLSSDFDNLGTELIVGMSHVGDDTGAVYKLATPSTPAAAVTSTNWALYP